MVIQKRSLTVYEIVNERRREIFVSATREPIFKLAADLKTDTPKAIAHWDLAEATSIRSIEFGLDERGAEAFIERYVASALPPGWRYLRNNEEL